MQNAQSVALQLEKVRDKLPLLYERDDILLTNTRASAVPLRIVERRSANATRTLVINTVQPGSHPNRYTRNRRSRTTICAGVRCGKPN